MTNEQIIKALEACLRFMDCDDCPCLETKPDLDEYSCRLELMSDACEHIKKQQKEIKSLKRQSNMVNRFLKEAWGRIDKLDKLNETVRTEAIKEFAERLCNETLPKCLYGHDEIGLRLSIAITNLVKEMVGVNNE